MNLRDKIYGMIFKLMQEEVVALWNECVHEGMGTDCLYVYSMDDFDEILLNKDISPVEIMWAVYSGDLSPYHKWFCIHWNKGLIGFDDIYLRDSVLDMYRLANFIADHPNIDIDNSEIKQAITCMESETDEDCIPF